ncbi:Isy1 pre-mRNA-splicing factor [Candida orthopsilosis Co 90-125]|uniref:Pre-mRNA-splicing factor ISY1 n=1 Tax=Candida orthopsilosis (strain 90-125) TaxID=1136231 RepID=H8XA90_CANO9|nr:Isy1 pre-mRNA-splicing factor [Candida orthopsilosis Co 90-125]CCG25067.1 Isy1 pre-mRNA-splicing factor [Candida orthopsilosis Co 90-125]
MSLNNFQQYKSKESGALDTNPQNRPRYVQKVQSIPQAEIWRNIVLGEISSKLTQINDSQTSDVRLRELNDALNQLFKEKRSWEYHIKNLGGNDYIHNVKDMINSGVNVAGWRYFGRAKGLPDVKKMIEEKKGQIEKQNGGESTKDLEKRLDDHYYGKLKDSKHLLDYESKQSEQLLKRKESERTPKVSLSELPNQEQITEWLAAKNI